MLYLINPQFINMETSTKTENDNTILKTRFKTIKTVSVKTKKPFFRYLATLTGSRCFDNTDYDSITDFDYDKDDKCYTTSTIPNKVKPGQNDIYIDTVNDGENPHDATVVIMAIPFSGILKQIPKSKDYRILAGCIVRSSEGITFEGKDYTSVLYLVMTLDPAFSDKLHKHHKNIISITVESYQIPSGTSGNIECTVETRTFNFYDHGDVGMGTDETLDCQINVEEVLGIYPTWFTYRPNKKSDAKKTESSTPKDNKKASQPSKEFKEASRKSESNLDEMIKKSDMNSNKGGKSPRNRSFMFEESFDDGRPKSKRKGNKGKNNNKRRNNYDYD